MKLNVSSVLFLGVGGVSMHQIALIFKSFGIKVFGYDMQSNNYTKILASEGVKITDKFEKEFCRVDMCIKTGAIKDDNKYISYLQELGVPIVERFSVLFWLCKKFKTVIAVAGTHGKSTTSGLIYHILRQNGYKVSCHIGADVEQPRFDINDDYLVVEACEYKKSFLSLYPNISVITNIEADHMDCYKNMFELRANFWKFLKRAKVRYVGDNKSTSFMKKYKNICFVKKEINFDTNLKGEFNQENIALAFRVCKDLGVDEKDILNSIKDFKSLPRRQEYIGNYLESKVYIDYAHHPTEIKSFISSIEDKNIQVVFQPHTYSRTKYLLNSFIDVLSKIDNLIIFKEYPARETPDVGVSAKELAFILKQNNAKVKYVAKETELNKYLISNGTIAFVGAGNIDVVAEKLINNKKSS